MTSSERNNPGYTPEYKELEEARAHHATLLNARMYTERLEADPLTHAIYLLAAEVRVMRLEKALEQ